MKSFVKLAATGIVCASFAGCTSDLPTEKEPTTRTSRQALVTSFAANSFIIPMDTGTNANSGFQNNGLFTAYGLVYSLLRAGIPVQWVVMPGKAASGDDLVLNAAGQTVVNHKSGVAVVKPVAYAGGPFVIAAADHDRALTVIDAWQATGGDTTVVHELTAGTFDADIVKTLAIAPEVGVLNDGFEAVARANLNAARIPDSRNQAWDAASPTSFTLAAAQGTAADNADGALFGGVTGGSPVVSFLASEHYNTPASAADIATANEITAEIRSYLAAGVYTHLFAQCAAIDTLENRPIDGANPGGHFLTTTGLTVTATDANPGGAPPPPAPLTLNLPSDPVAQIDGAFVADTGTGGFFALPAGGAFVTGTRTLISATNTTTTLILVTGNLDGATTNGRVTYLAGHDYNTATPVTGGPGNRNTLANGARIFFNALLDSPSALEANAPVVTLTVVATPASPTNASTITYTITYTNTGKAPAQGLVIKDTIPAGSTFASAMNGGTEAGGVVTFPAISVAPGATGSVSFTVNVPTDATYADTATGAYFAWRTPKTATSNTTSTVRDTAAPDTVILTMPAASTPMNTATFTFGPVAPEAGVTFECKLDAEPDFTACPSPKTYNGPLGLGSHTFSVRGKDALGNTDATPATYTWTVIPGDTTAPDTQILTHPDAVTTATTGTFTFDTSPTEAGASFECKLDAEPDFTACTSGKSYPNLAVGSHTFSVRGKDAVGNTDASPSMFTWTIKDGDAGTTPPDAGPVDTDGDGLTDAVEKMIGTDPNDADSDDDGVPDGMEPDFDKDTDGDGLINALDPDSDNDGLFDGTEMGLGCGGPGVNLAAKHCVADADSGATKTNPLDRDTDKGGATDGSEDSNLNGAIDAGETDPTVGHGADDNTNVDTDGDGLSDKLEMTLGSDPMDADSDDDGLKDGEEPNPGVDTDGDGKKNVSDSDSDGDGLFDGTESGKGCDDAATDKTKNMCVADADPTTKTSPIDPDTDHGGVKDGVEDANKNGKVDPGERNPLDKADDMPTIGSDGGVTADGGVNGKPDAGSDAGGATGDASPLPPNSLEGGGISCAMLPGDSGSTSNVPPLALGVVLALAVRRVRRRRSH